MGKPWLVVLGLLEKEAYELFAGGLTPELAEKLPTNLKATSSDRFLVRKIHSGVYDLIDPCNGVILENITDLIQNDTEKALTRMISTSLRHGVPVEFIVDQLERCEGSIVEFSKAASRILKHHINTIQSPTNKDICPNCLGTQLILEEGCNKCLDCGWSKCG